MKLSIITDHSHTLLESIVSLYTEDAAPSWPQTMSDQVVANPKFTTWLKSIGITGPVGKPMHGGVGRAYPIGDKFIAKFTTDEKEARAAAIMKGHDSAHAADIYGVHRVLSFDSGGLRKNLYVIAMQRLNTGVGGRMRAAGNAVYQYLDDHGGFIEDVDAVVSVVLAKYVGEGPRPNRALKNDPGMVTAVRKVVRGLYDVQQKTGVLSQDPHGGNVAFKGREAAFFDMGRSSMDLDHPKAQGARLTALPEA